MTTARRIEDPLATGVQEQVPIGSYRSWKGLPGFFAGKFLYLQRVPKKKCCATCNRGTRLQFSYGDLKWRRCRRHLTPDEKALLWLMLTEAEVGN